MPWQEPEEENPDEWTKGIGGAFSFFSPKGGKKDFVDNRIRLLPPHSDSADGKFYKWVAIHGNLPGIGRPVYCPYKNDGEQCPACAKSKEHYDRGDKAGGSEWGSTWRAMVNLITFDEDGDVIDGEIKVWGMPKTVMEELKRVVSKLPAGTRNVAHPLTGRDIIISRKGEKLGTDYRVTVEDVSEVSDAVLEILEEPDGLSLLDSVYEKKGPSFIAGLLTAPNVEVDDPFDAEDVLWEPDVEEIIEAEVREIVEPEPEEEPAPSKRGKAAPKAAAATVGESPRDRLKKSLGLE